MQLSHLKESIPTLALVVVGVIGTFQAMEAIKLLTGVGISLAGYVLYYDAKRAEWRKLKLSKREQCPTCST